MSVHSFLKSMVRKNDKKELIINAAVKVFADKGFYNAKVADVAKKAGVADGTIYLYFKNKDDLLISLFETKMEKILERFSSIIKSNLAASEKLKRFIYLYFQIIEEDQDLAEVFQVELRQSGKFLKDYHNQNFIDFLNLLGDIIYEGKQIGEFREDIGIHNMKLAIFGALDEISRQWILTEDPSQDLDQTAVEITDMFLKSLKTEKI
jgi:TetR/AcrR family fatty acid metabolism transcriptional regulator